MYETVGCDGCKNLACDYLIQLLLLLLYYLIFLLCNLSHGQ